MIEEVAFPKGNRSPIKKVGCCSRLRHGLYHYSISILAFTVLIGITLLFPVFIGIHIHINTDFYDSLRGDMCNISTVIYPTQLPNISTIGWMACNCNGPSYMSCIEMFTNESNTSLVRSRYEYETQFMNNIMDYLDIQIPGKYNKCTLMNYCACNSEELNQQLNESIKTYNQYFNKSTKCFHDNNYENLYLEKGNFIGNRGIRIVVIFLTVIGLSLVILLTCQIGSLISYVCGNREFLDSYDAKAYNDSTYFFSDNNVVSNPVYNTNNLPEWPNADRNNLDYYYTRTRIQTDEYDA